VPDTTYIALQNINQTPNQLFQQNKNDFHFSHILFNNNQGIISNSYKFFSPIFEKLDVKVLVRSKLNLTVKESSKRNN